MNRTFSRILTLFSIILVVFTIRSAVPSHTIFNKTFPFSFKKTKKPQSFFEVYVQEYKTKGVLGMSVFPYFLFKAHCLSEIIIPLGMCILIPPTASFFSAVYKCHQKEDQFMKNAFVRSKFQQKKTIGLD